MSAPTSSLGFTVVATSEELSAYSLDAQSLCEASARRPDLYAALLGALSAQIGADLAETATPLVTVGAGGGGDGAGAAPSAAPACARAPPVLAAPARSTPLAPSSAPCVAAAAGAAGSGASAADISALATRLSALESRVDSKLDMLLAAMGKISDGRAI